MRIFLLPISTRRTLLYCDKSSLAASTTTSSTASPTAAPSITDRIVDRANRTWAEWESSPNSFPLDWKRRLTHYGNLAFRRIPFEEWGLKSLPPLSTADRSLRPDVLFPRGVGEFRAATTTTGSQGRGKVVEGVLRRLATERQGLHRTRLIWSVVGMPLAVPFGLIPVLPNVPFFYLAFRAWSHYRALYGARYLEWIVGEGQWSAKEADDLARVYAGVARRLGTAAVTRSGSGSGTVAAGGKGQGQDGKVAAEQGEEEQETLLLDATSGAELAKRYDIAEMQLEVERAVEQVEKALAAAEDKKWEERRQKSLQGNGKDKES